MSLVQCHGVGVGTSLAPMGTTDLGSWLGPGMFFSL